MAYSTNTKKREVIEYFSFLRVIACIGILFLHSFSTSFSMYKETLNLSHRFISQIGSLSFMWAVPIFVMVSGALLLNPEKEISIHDIIFKYIKRMGIALIMFGILFQLYDVITTKNPLTWSILLDSLKNIVQGTSWSQLWYIYLLIGLYCILPLLRGFVKSATNQEIKFILGALFLFLSVVPLLELANISIGFYIHFSTIYPFYFLVGYALHNRIISINKTISIGMVAFGMIGIIFSVYGSVYGQLENMNVLWNYPSIPVVLESIGLFSLFTHIKKRNKFVSLVDQVSFGIYLIHMVFTRYILEQGIIKPYQGHLIINVCLLVLISFILSGLISYLLKKLPLFKTIL